MIKISIKKNDNKIDAIIASGHANNDIYGKDIVCASVSTLLITHINLMKSIDENAISYESKDGYINLEVLKHSLFIDKVLENMEASLEELALNYKKNIKINK